jgi:hypothetical protein
MDLDRVLVQVSKTRQQTASHARHATVEEAASSWAPGWNNPAISHLSDHPALDLCQRGGRSEAMGPIQVV